MKIKTTAAVLSPAASASTGRPEHTRLHMEQIEDDAVRTLFEKFLKKPTMLNRLLLMKVGESIRFPIDRYDSARSYSSQVSAISGGRWSTRLSRDEGCVYVIRKK